MQYHKHVVSGVTWTTIQTFINRGMGFIVKLILARLLFPEDYGLIGMAIVFAGIFKVFTDLGFGSAIIQRKEELVTIQYLSTAYWTNLIWSICLYIALVFVIGPFAASFYKEPILLYVIPALGISVISTPLFYIQKALLVRNLKFKKIAVINNSGSIIGGVLAIVMAILDMGVWALVAQSFFQTIVEFVLYNRYVKWKPILVLDKSSFKDMFGFGAYTTLSALIYKFSTEGINLFIGKILGKIELGLYSFAYILTDSIRVQIRQIIDMVMYPIYSKNQDEKNKQLYLLEKSIFFNSLILTPIMGTMFICTDIITIVFGEKWFGSIIIVKIVALSVIVQTVSNSFSTIMRANNLNKVEFNLQLVKVLFVFVPIVFIGTYYYGIVGTSLGVLISRIIMNQINLFAMSKYLAIPNRILYKAFFDGSIPTFISALLTFLIFYFIHDSLLLNILKVIVMVIFIFLFTFLLQKKIIFQLIKRGR
jgi:teichuronic acid exporter